MTREGEPAMTGRKRLAMTGEGEPAMTGRKRLAMTGIKKGSQ
jgi:hypothetical protein